MGGPAEPFGGTHAYWADVRTHPVLLAPVLALFVVASACSEGGGDSASSAASSAAGASSLDASSSKPSIPDPCTLVAAEQLLPLVGRTPVTTGPTDQFRGTSCHWEADDGAGSSLDLTVWPGREFFSSTLGSAPVAGLGDEAEADSSLARVIWRQGDITAQLLGLGIGEGGTDKVVALARAVADRISTQ